MSTLHKTLQADLRRTRWRLDESRSTVAFAVRHMYGIVTIKGRFERFSGGLDLRDGHQPAAELTVHADSVNTKIGARDKHLRSATFFDVEQHPLVRFSSTAVTLDGDRLRLRGALHAAGAQVPLEVDAAIRRVDGELAVELTAHADQRALGMPSPLGMIRAPAKLILDGRLVPDA